MAVRPARPLTSMHRRFSGGGVRQQVEAGPVGEAGGAGERGARDVLHARAQVLLPADGDADGNLLGALVSTGVVVVTAGGDDQRVGEEANPAPLDSVRRAFNPRQGALPLGPNRALRSLDCFEFLRAHSRFPGAVQCVGKDGL